MLQRAHAIQDGEASDSFVSPGFKIKLNSRVLSYFSDRLWLIAPPLSVYL